MPRPNRLSFLPHCGQAPATGRTPGSSGSAVARYGGRRRSCAVDLVAGGAVVGHGGIAILALASHDRSWAIDKVGIAPTIEQQNRLVVRFDGIAQQCLEPAGEEMDAGPERFSCRMSMRSTCGMCRLPTRWGKVISRRQRDWSDMVSRKRKRRWCRPGRGARLNDRPTALALPATVQPAYHVSSDGVALPASPARLRTAPA